VGVDDDDDLKSEIRMDMRDEFGRIMTPKKAFRMISSFMGLVLTKRSSKSA
jgi:hypothetical protein